MGAWGTSIFSDDLAQDIRSEYNILLSVGKENSEIETMLTNYYSSILNCNNPDEDVFWFSLALCEWKKGRLSSTAKAKALSALESGCDLARWNTADNQKNYEKRRKVLSEFRETILSPLPPVTKVKKPTVHHCPWKLGSLLAYRIISNEDTLRNHPCFMKYVLLRVVKIDKHPISKLFPTEYYDETMLVGLYNWIGSAVPNPEKANNLEYIPIEKYSLAKSLKDIDFSFFDVLPEESQKKITAALFDERIEKCVQLDWRPSKYAKGDITYLGCDETFQDNIPEFFKSSLHSRTLTHFLPFDVTLSKIFEARFSDNPGDKR